MKLKIICRMKFELFDKLEMEKLKSEKRKTI